MIGSGGEAVLSQHLGDRDPILGVELLAAAPLSGSMVGMIALSRQFELQMKMMQTTESNEQKATQLLSLKG